MFLKTLRSFNPFEDDEEEEDNAVADSIDDALGGFLKAFDVIDKLLPGGNPDISSIAQGDQTKIKQPTQPIQLQPQPQQIKQNSLTAEKLTDKTSITPTRQRSAASLPDTTTCDTTTQPPPPPQPSRIVKANAQTANGRYDLGDEFVKAATDITSVLGDVALGMGSVFGTVLDTVGKGVSNGVNSGAAQVMGAAGLTDYAIKQTLQANLAEYARFSPMDLQVADQGDRIVLNNAVACDCLRELMPVPCLQIKMECATILGLTSSYKDSLPDTPITPVKMRMENTHITIALTMVQAWALRLYFAHPILESFLRDVFLFKDLFMAWSCGTIPAGLGGFRINAALFNAEHTDRISVESELVIHAMYLSDVVFTVKPLKGPGCYRIEIQSLNIDVNPSPMRIATLHQLLDTENAPELRRKRDMKVKSIALAVLICLCAVLYQILR